MPSRWDGVCLLILFYKHAVPTGHRNALLSLQDRDTILAREQMCDLRRPERFAEVIAVHN